MPSGVLVISETRDDNIRGVTAEAASAGRRLADVLGGSCHALLAGSAIAAQAENLGAYGIERVYVAESEGLALLDRFGLADKASQYPDRLSGGQQQRVAIVRSLAVKPRLMLMDEVTSALDPVLVNEVLQTVSDLKSEGMTMMIATHEMGFASQVADEVCYLAGGRIVERGSPEQVLGDPQDPSTRDFLRRVHEAGRI